MIETEHLRKVFHNPHGPVEAVKDVSFTVKRGELFGFLGPNGAGKTTTINLLCTLLRPTSGRVLLNGLDVVEEPHRVRECIGLVFQDPSLDERLTAWENIEFHAMLYHIPKPVRRDRIQHLLEVVGLTPRAHDLVGTFSGGMRRRLELIRGLLHRPKVLFLDEPTLGLDPQTRSRIWEYLEEVRSTQDVTLFLTTHYMDEAEQCDRIGIIDHGRIIALDTPGSLKRKIGGEVLILRTEEEDRMAPWLASQYGLTVERTEEGLACSVARPEELLPRLLKETPFGIEAVTIHRPTLEDVFLKLTGHAIREESLDRLGLYKAKLRRRRE
jgi:ABC-2 type transport system ATP-binding protein